jgi:RNA polymerase sigma factor (sigma-70 family)
MPTALVSSDRPKWQVDRYVAAVRDEVLRTMVKRHGRFDADDITSNVLTKLWARIDEYMEKYPDPVVFAHAVCHNEAVDFFRKENVQRCCGARNQRTTVYGDAPNEETGLSFFDAYDKEGIDVAEMVVKVLDERYRWAEIALGIPARQLEAMRLTFVEGHTDAEAAIIMDVARESVNRWKNAGKKRLLEMLA